MEKAGTHAASCRPSYLLDIFVTKWRVERSSHWNALSSPPVGTDERNNQSNKCLTSSNKKLLELI